MTEFCIWDEIRGNPDYRVYYHAADGEVWESPSVKVVELQAPGNETQFVILNPAIESHPDFEIYVEYERRRQHEGEAEPWADLEWSSLHIRCIECLRPLNAGYSIDGRCVVCAERFVNHD